MSQQSDHDLLIEIKGAIRTLSRRLMPLEAVVYGFVALICISVVTGWLNNGAKANEIKPVVTAKP